MGTVMDFNEAVIPDAVIIFNGEQIKRQVTSDAAGKYTIELPAGLYEISTNLISFSPFQRAAFRVRPNIDTMINVVPVPLAVSYGSEAPKFQHDFLSLPSTVSESQEMAIRFRERQEGDGFVKYSGAMASYDVLAIYADKLQCDPKTAHLIAEGNVIVEDGKQRIHVKRAEVEFKEGEPILKLTK